MIDLERELENQIECPRCEGMGYIDIGDVEDGVTEECMECNGSGSVDA